MKNSLRLLLLIILLIGGFSYFSNRPSGQPITPSPTPTVQLTPTTGAGGVLGVRTKLTNCQPANGLPDFACTPGAVFTGITAEQVCQSGYAKSVRNVPADLKDQVYQEYGISSHQVGEYEVDHLISLELGGSNEIANLWPEASEPRPGFHEKDQVENYLHQEVCSGKITLLEAQQQIVTNWLKVYQELPN